MTVSLSQALRNLRRHWPESLLAITTLSASWAILIHLGVLFQSFELQGLSAGGKRLFVVREAWADRAARRGLSAPSVDALSNLGNSSDLEQGKSVYRIIHDDLMRFNLKSSSTYSTKLVGAADYRALQIMGASLSLGSFWQNDELELRAVISSATATELFGGSSLAVGKSIQIQGRLFSVAGVLGALPKSFEDVSVWTNQVDDVESLFNNGLRLAPPSFAIIEWPQSKSDSLLRQQLDSRAKSLIESMQGPYRGMKFVPQRLNDYLVNYSIRLGRTLWQTVALALISATITVWLLVGVRSLRASRDNQIRIFLGLERQTIYWESVIEQSILAFLAFVCLCGGSFFAATFGFGVPIQLKQILDLLNPYQSHWLWSLAIFAFPVLNIAASVLIHWLLLNWKRNRALRIEPLIACHVATTVTLWMLVSLFAQDLAAAWTQSRHIPSNLYTTMLTMPDSKNSNSISAAPIQAFSAELTRRIRQSAPNAKIGFSTWIPFLDNSSTDYLRLPQEEPLKGVDDDRIVDFIACTHSFLSSFHPNLLAGQFPGDQNVKDNWIVLDSVSAHRHFQDLSKAIGERVELLRGTYRVAAVIEAFSFRGDGAQRMPQVFLNFDHEQALFPYLSISLEIPLAPARAPAILRDQIKSQDPRISPFRIESVQAAIERATQPNRTAIRWLSLLIFSVALAMGLGIYSVARSIIEFRRGDFATMLALGAGKGAIIRFAFFRLGSYCFLGMLIGIWGGLFSCLQFSDQITVDPKFLFVGAFQAVLSVFLVGLLSILPSIYQLFGAPLSDMLKERGGVAMPFPWAQ